MNSKKRILLLILTIVMLISSLPLTAFANTGNISEQPADDKISDWLMYDSYFDEKNGHFVLTEDHTSWETGAIWYNQPCYGNLKIELDYYTGTTDRPYQGADGIVVAFYADRGYEMSSGESLGFDGCNGYGIEIDTFCNSHRGDPDYNHISLIRGDVGNHLITKDISGSSEDEMWHHLTVEINNNVCAVYIDGTLMFSYYVENTGFGQIGITSATGSGHNLHAVKNVKITNNQLSSGTSAQEKYLNVTLSHHVESETENNFDYQVKVEITNNSSHIAKNVNLTLDFPTGVEHYEPNERFLYNIQPGETRVEYFYLAIPKSLSDEVIDYTATTRIDDSVILTTTNKIYIGKLVEIKSTATSTPLQGMYSDNFFIKNEGYNHNLAWLTLCLELSSWTKNEKKSWGAGDVYNSASGAENVSQIVKDRTANISDAYKQMEFDEVSYYNYDITLNDSSDKVAYSIAKKKDVCGATLIAITIRGGGYGAEWSSNFNVGNSNYHQGFHNAAQDVFNHLSNEISATEGQIKFWVTGYSRGAAVANILSAKLCDYSLYSSKFTTDDIFAYTFATPQGVMKKAITSKSLYAKIYNMVNPGDIVSTVAFSKWGFTRYGTTKYFSPLTHTRNNITQSSISEVNQSYREFSNDLSFDALENLNQSTLNEALVKIITRRFPTVKSSLKLQKVISELMEYYNMKELDETGKYVNISTLDYHKILATRYEAKYVLAKINAEANIKLNNYAILAGLFDYELTLMVLTIGELHGLSSFELADLAKSIICCAENWADLIVANPTLEQVGQLATGHMPEVYLAWMNLDENHTFGITNNLTTKVLTIACPVNITVYDENGEVVAIVENHKIIETDITIITDEECTEIYLSPFDEQKYTVEITATDEGSMDYTVTEYNLDGDAVIRAIYYDIPLDNQQKFTASFETLGDFANDKYDLITTEGESEIRISVSDIIQGENSEVNLSIEVVGAGSVDGERDYVIGDLVQLTALAEPGNIFSGWFLNDVLISTEANYTFEIKENTELLAKFEPCEHIWETIEIIKEPTHTEFGEEIKVCTICNETSQIQIEKTAEHIFGEYITEREPTKKEAGVRKKVCPCGYIITESIPPLGNSHNTLAVIIILCLGLGLGLLIFLIIKKSRGNSKKGDNTPENKEDSENQTDIEIGGNSPENEEK